MQTSIIVLYDQHCSICRLLASLLTDMAPEGWKVLPWQAHNHSTRDEHPEELVVLEGEARWEGEAAWQLLIERVPRLRAYQNLAARIGLSPPRSARWLRRIGQGLRRLCGACPGTFGHRSSRL
jgi:predicted DCC family thiol-disulfide oxidoreductase YuxK